MVVTLKSLNAFWSITVTEYCKQQLIRIKKRFVIDNENFN